MRTWPSHPHTLTSLVATSSFLLVASCAGMDELLSDSPPGISTPGNAPTSGGGTLAMGEETRGAIRGPNLANEYTFDGLQGQEVQIFIQNTSAESNSVVADLRALYGGSSLFDAPAVAHTGHPWLSRSSSVATLPEDGTYTLRVEGSYTAGQRNEYRMLLHELNRSPESISARIRIGQEVTGEAVDLPHDVDDFFFEARQGQRIQVVLQSQSQGSLSVWAHLYPPGSDHYVGSVAAHAGQPWMSRTTDPVEITESGLWRVEIGGFYEHGQPNPYRFLVMEVN